MTLIKELGADNPNRIRKSNEVALTLENHELMAIHNTVEQLMVIQIDFRSSYWLSRTYDRLEAALKKIKQGEDDLIQKYATYNEGGRYRIDQPGTGKTDEENLKLADNLAAFKEEIKKLHMEKVEVEVFTVDVSHFIKANAPSLVSFEGRFWSLLKDVITGEPDYEAMKFLSLLDTPKTDKPSKILTE